MVSKPLTSGRSRGAINLNPSREIIVCGFAGHAGVRLGRRKEILPSKAGHAACALLCKDKKSLRITPLPRRGEGGFICGVDPVRDPAGGRPHRSKFLRGQAGADAMLYSRHVDA